MRLLTLAALSALVFPTAATAQNVGSNCDSYLDSQAEVDAFDCTVLADDLYIDDAGITNLAGLSELTFVGGDLEIDDNANLTSLVGLNNLQSVGGYLEIYDNASLTSLAGLNNLQSVGDYVEIDGNDNLTSLVGLEGLLSIGDYLEIDDNDNLTSLVGLNNLQSVGSYLEIYRNDNLTSLVGLESLQSAGDYLDIDGNDGLTSLSGLESLQSIDEIDISRNNSLTSLSGLEDLRSIDHLTVRENAGMTSLAGLNALLNVRILTVQNNAALTSLAGLEDLQSSTSINVRSNANLTSLAGLDSQSIGGLTVQENAGLTSLSALDNLQSVGGNLIIGANNQLTSLAGLENLQSVAGDLSIGSNNQLTSLAGLGDLQSVGGVLSVGPNASLTSLSGLENLQSVGILLISGNDELVQIDALARLAAINRTLGFSYVSLIINDNPKLVRCAVGLGPVYTLDAADNSVISGSSTFSGNDPAGDCTSIAAILAAYVPPAPSTLPLANASLSFPGGALVLPAGRGAVRVTAAATYTGETEQRFTVFVRLDGPGGYSRVAKRGEIKPQPGQSVSQSIKFSTLPADPAGAYTVRLLVAEGSVPMSAAGDAEVIAALPATKLGGAGLRVAEALRVYPNPAAETATLRFGVAEAGPAVLAIYDALGREVARPVDGGVEGVVEASLDASALPAGVYVARLTTASGTETVRLTVVR